MIVQIKGNFLRGGSLRTTEEVPLGMSIGAIGAAGGGWSLPFWGVDNASLGQKSSQEDTAG